MLPQGTAGGVDAAAEGLLQAWLGGTADLVFALDADLRLTVTSASLAEFAGRPSADLIGLDVVEARLFGDAAARLHAHLREAAARLEGAAGGDPLPPFDFTWAGPGGRARLFRLQTFAAGDAAGRLRRLLVCARDISEQQRVEEHLRRREHDFRTLAENSPDAIIRYGPDLRAVYCNREIEEHVTVSATRIVGRTPAEAAPPGMRGVEAYEAQLRRTLSSGEVGSIELHVPHPSGEMRVHSVVFAPEHDASGAICGAVAVGRDVTEQVRVRQALAEKERAFRTLAENAIDNIARWDADARIVYFNPVMSRVFGSLAGEAIGRTPTELSPNFAPVEEAVRRVVREGQPILIELRFPAAGGEELVHEIRFVPEHGDGGAVVSVLGIGRDITEKIAQFEKIEALVRTDVLTGLANRQALHERAPRMLAAARRNDRKVGLMLLDIDHFKSVNDGLGHSAGDAMLREIARRLSACMRSNDMLVRLGGDEFVVVVNELDDPEVVGAVAAKLHRALAEPLQLEMRPMHVTASVGVAVYPCDGEGLEQLLSHADSAMYHAKRSGRARTEYYRRELGEAIERRLLLESTLREARHGAGLELHLQPQVRMRDGRVLGAEGLLRWRHPALGMLAPDAFVALAEETGTIVPIGRWVLRTAAEAVARWNRGRDTPLTVAVNVSTRQFVDDDLPAAVRQALAETGCEPAWLSVEITESALVEDSALVQRALEALRDLGVRIALDDFGTGYSSLSYLARFPVDCLKIDKSFVQAIGRSEREDELVKAFIAMAHALKLRLVAEGVETEAQAAFLLEHGCETGQGYRFGRPAPLAGFEAMTGRQPSG